MEYEIIITAFVEADSAEEAEQKYRDFEISIDQHQIYFYDDDGNRVEIPDEVYNQE